MYTRSDINEKPLTLPRARYVCNSILTLPFTFTAEPRHSTWQYLRANDSNSTISSSRTFENN